MTPLQTGNLSDLFLDPWETGVYFQWIPLTLRRTFFAGYARGRARPRVPTRPPARPRVRAFRSVIS